MKILIHENGRTKEYTPLVASGGGSDAGKVVQTGNDGKLDPTLFPNGFGKDALQVRAGVGLTAGDFVNIYADPANGGQFSLRRACADNTSTQADGYILENAAPGQMVTMYFDDSNPMVADMAPGTVWLSLSPGKATNTPVEALNNRISQILGVATSPTTVHVALQAPINLAG